MIRVTSVEMQGFRAYRSAAFAPSEKSALVAITGRTKRPGFSTNAAGKSSILHAISWCLYGQMLSPGTDAESMIRSGDDTVSCTVKLSDGHVITRSRKRGRSATLQITSPDGSSATAGTRTITESALHADILGATFPLFRVSVAFAATQDAARFSRVSDGEKRKLLSSIVGLSRYSVAQENARAELRDIHATVDRLKQKLDVKSAELKAVKNTVPPPEPVLPIPVMPPDPLPRAEKTDTAERLATAKAEARTLARDCDRAKSAWEATTKPCPTCKRPPDVSAKKTRKAERAYKKLAFAADAMEVEVEILQRALDAETESRREKRSVFEKKQAKYEQYQLAHAAYLRACEEHQTWEATQQAKIKKLRKAKARIQAEIHTAVTSSAPTEFWAEHFGPKKLPAQLTDHTLAAISAMATENIRAIVSPDCEIKLASTRTNATGRELEEVDIRVNIPGFAPTYRDLSVGTQSRVDIAITLALATGGLGPSRWGQMFVDEVFDGLDDAGCYRVVERLRAIADSTKRQIILVTNDNRLAEAADEIWEVRHDGEGCAMLGRV